MKIIIVIRITQKILINSYCLQSKKTNKQTINNKQKITHLHHKKNLIIMTYCIQNFIVLINIDNLIKSV